MGKIKTKSIFGKVYYYFLTMVFALGSLNNCFAISFEALLAPMSDCRYFSVCR